MAYDNIQEVLAFCYDWLTKNINGFTEDADKGYGFTKVGKAFSFSTKTLNDYYKENDEWLDSKKCSYFCGSDGAIIAQLLLHKNNDGNFTKAQQKIVDSLNITRKSNTQIGAIRTKLLERDERELKLDDEMKKKLLSNLYAFKCKLEELEAKI